MFYPPPLSLSLLSPLITIRCASIFVLSPPEIQRYFHFQQREGGTVGQLYRVSHPMMTLVSRKVFFFSFLKETYMFTFPRCLGIGNKLWFFFWVLFSSLNGKQGKGPSSTKLLGAFVCLQRLSSVSAAEYQALLVWRTWNRLFLNVASVQMS